jgi:uncharacterized iron-regulated protein
MSPERALRPRRVLRPLAAAAVLLAAGCTAAAPPPARGEDPALAMRWEAPLGRDHPLAGRVWDAGAQALIRPAQLVRRLTRARYVILGEKHDNPDHHRLQAWVLRRLIVAGRRPVVGFEMIDTGDAPALAAHLAASPRDAAGLGEALRWEQSGWPPWSMYEPIAQTALDAGLPLVAANLPGDVARALARHGLPGADFDLVSRLRIDELPPPAVQAAMAAEIREGHCGVLGEASVERMVLAQRARDAQMALSLTAADRGDGGVLIAGAGHARTDHGVPAHLDAFAPRAPVAAVAFLEVRAGDEDVAAYAERHGGHLPFDYVWFTPRVDDRDPCERFRARPGG